MKSTTNVNLNVQLPNYSTVIYAVQGDVMSREISATLMDGSSPFTPPYGVLGSIRYMKPDGTVGLYDTMEDESTPAVVITGNVATILLAEQMLTVVGEVIAQLSLYSEEAERLSTFTFKVMVEANPYTDEEFESTDYYSVLTADIASILAVVNNMPAPATDVPLMDGTAAIGVKGEFARSDHVHPHDTSKLDASSFVLATATPEMDGTAAAGTSTKVAREDHVHPHDTTKADALVYGSNANGSYLKLPDGTMFCWKTVTFENLNITTAWGSDYETSARQSFGSWAATFYSKPAVFVTTQQVSGSVTGFVEQVSSVSTTSAGESYIFSPKSTSNGMVVIGLLGVGRWKA